MSLPRDYRGMLYRFDLATKYDSVPSLVQHMMDETVIDGVLELRMVTSTTGAGPSDESTGLGLPTTYFISFRREGKNVNAVALYGPRSSPTPGTDSPSNRPSASRPGLNPNNFALEVKKRFPPNSTLVWIFCPLVDRLFTRGASSVIFECRSYLASSDVAREVRVADLAASAAAAQEREARYLHPNQNQVYDPNAPQWQQGTYATQPAGYNVPAVAPSVLNPGATYHLPNPVYANTPPISHMPGQQHYSHPQPTGYEHTNNPGPSTPAYPQQRPQRRSGEPSPRGQQSTPSPPRPDDETAMELLNRRAPFKRMVGYAGKQRDGSLAVYELADAVAAIAWNDAVSSFGMAGVEAMGTINLGTTQAPSPASLADRGGSSSRRL